MYGKLGVIKFYRVWQALKVLDILACKLKDSKSSRWVELPLEEFLQLTDYPITESSKNAVRSRLGEHTALLRKLSMDWVEKDGRYSYREVKLFDEIVYRNGRVCARFSEAMALYLLRCPSISLPLPLLAVKVRSPNSYFLGRKCLVYHASNKGREWQPIRAGSLLASCPSIPIPDPGKRWQPSLLERKVISPFTAAMDTLKDSGILVWEFREPARRDNYDGFVNNVVKFQVLDGTASTLPAESAESKKEQLGSFDYDSFLALR